MNERPTLTISASCPTCGGTGIELIPHRHYEGASSGYKRCLKCKGDGTIRQAVKCGGCRYWNQWFYCSRLGAYNIGPDFGCPLWQAREGA